MRGAGLRGGVPRGAGARRAADLHDAAGAPRGSDGGRGAGRGGDELRRGGGVCGGRRVRAAEIRLLRRADRRSACGGSGVGRGEA